MTRRKTTPRYTPGATYRLQFNAALTFEKAAELVEYLDALGVTDVYSSPFLMARPGSLHGYDVTNHSRFNPEIGDETSFGIFSKRLKQRGMGLIVDVVPNHMCISHPSNEWWWDVLENGPSSSFGRFFDIEWHPPKAELANKVLLPVLGDQYGRVLEGGGIRIVYKDGRFEAVFYDTPLPLAPATWPMILEPAAARLRGKLDAAHEHVLEIESIITALGHFAGLTETDEAKLHERQREKEVVKRRLAALVEGSSELTQAIEDALVEINGQAENPPSFDRLEKLLERQAYRLSYWRVAMDEINYRRFFDINDLAAIRVEDPEVFSAVHALIFDLVRRGDITGLRVDHPDGLAEPEKYFRYLQDACKAQSAATNGARNANSAFYIVAEKILMRNESLRQKWAVAGTTGYEFLNWTNDLFVDDSKEKAFRQLYRRFTGLASGFEDLVCDSKRLILQVAMSSELNTLSRHLDHISEQHRWSRDFTLENLRDALREVLASFPVYRTYIRSEDNQVDLEDRREVSSAIHDAKRRNRAISESVFDFIQRVLLLEFPDGLADAQRAEWRMFTTRFQQLSSPVMAKGVEDTAFYRYYPLASLNEVGGDPEQFGITVKAFHRKNVLRRKTWPNGMNATSTHDTKRGEDARARINVLSEMPEEWYRAIRRWHGVNHKWKTKTSSGLMPDQAAEYLLYQSLIGTWPLYPMKAGEHREYVERIQAYMKKAVREAKVHTSWISPNGEYEECLEKFVAGALSVSPENAFVADFQQFQGPIANAGIWNSLSQLLLKIASPGVPDFYQGNELWCFDLVDPDNRRPVDFERRRNVLSKLQTSNRDPGSLMERLVANRCDGAIKLYLTKQALNFRKDHSDLFAKGTYLPVATAGSRARHAIAFARTLGSESVIAVAGRFFVKLCNSHRAPMGETWGNTVISLPHGIGQQTFQNVFTGQVIEVVRRDGEARLPLASVFSHCPAALLVGVDGSGGPN